MNALNLVPFSDVPFGGLFSATFGEENQCRATFRKTAWNMAACLDGDWPMSFLLDELVFSEGPPL